MSTILVFVPQADGTPMRAGLECLGAAHATGATVIAATTGDGAADCAAALGDGGASSVIVLEGGDQWSPDAAAAALAGAASDASARAFLAPANSIGKDLAPRVAAHLDSTLFSDCIAFQASGEGFQVQRPWLAGKAIATLTSTSGTMCATTRLNVFDPVSTGASAEVSTRAMDAAPKARRISIEAKEVGKLDVKEAPVVISGGRGLKEAEHFSMLEGLADAFGDAAVGASRAVVDAGWRPHSEQVGQTGKTVAPQLYIAVGISGAIQHLAGMKDSKTIVAINKDPEAPIFQVADYGLVDDLFKVCPELTEKL